MASGGLRGSGLPRDQAGVDGCLCFSARAKGSPKLAGLLVTMDKGITLLHNAFIRFSGILVRITGT